MINVVNKYRHEATENDIYIGRGSVLGNKWSSKKSSKEYVIRTETREKSVKKYREWLKEKLTERDEKVIDELRKILITEQKNGEVNLVCFCKPKLCHGDIIKDFLKDIKKIHNAS